MPVIMIVFQPIAVIADQTEFIKYFIARLPQRIRAFIGGVELLLKMKKWIY